MGADYSLAVVGAVDRALVERAWARVAGRAPSFREACAAIRTYSDGRHADPASILTGLDLVDLHGSTVVFLAEWGPPLAWLVQGGGPEAAPLYDSADEDLGASAAWLMTTDAMATVVSALTERGLRDVATTFAAGCRMHVALARNPRQLHERVWPIVQADLDALVGLATRAQRCGGTLCVVAG